jgi:hypothetical protein
MVEIKKKKVHEEHERGCISLCYHLTYARKGVLNHESAEEQEREEPTIPERTGGALRRV